MRTPSIYALVLLLGASFPAFAQTSNGTTTAAVCHAGSDPGCLGQFTGMAFNGLNYNLPANKPDGSPFELSTMSLKPAGSGLQVFVHLQPWFTANQGNVSYPLSCTSPGVTCTCPFGACTANNYLENDKNHVQIGYNSSDQTTVLRQLNDMLTRRFDGVVVDWYSKYPAGNLENGTVQTIQSVLSNTSNGFCNTNGSCSLHFALVEDQGAWKRTNPNLAPNYQNCSPGPPPQTTDLTGCIQQHVFADIGDIDSTYATSAGYFKVNGHSVVQFFASDGLNDTIWPGANWTTIWQNVLPSAHNNNNVLIFKDAFGFTHYGYTDGSFAWTNFIGTNPDPEWSHNQSYLQEFYQAAAGTALQVWGVGYKGFDERSDQSRQSATRYIDQKCGQIWLNTINAVLDSSKLGGTTPKVTVPYAVLSTWNDYGEGTEIESGIDNCVDDNTYTASISGSILSWSFSFNSSDGTTDTIDHYEIHTAPTGSQVGPAISTSNCSPQNGLTVSCSYDLNNLGLGAGTYDLYVKEVSKNSITNHLSPAVPYVVGGGGGSECHVSADCPHYFYCQDFGCVPLPDEYCPQDNGCQPPDENPDYCRYPDDGCDEPFFRNYGGCCVWVASPIVIDLSGDGFSLTAATDGVLFDFLGNGVSTRISWTATGAKDAWLVLDRNGNGTIDSGKELFGNITEQPPSAEPNGFRALAEFDKPVNGGNGDGIIDARDAVFSRLRLWIDLNHNGISEPEELFTLESQGITAIDLNYQEKKWTDENGNRFRYRARVFGPAQGQSGNWAYDVFLVRDSGSGVPASFPPQ